MNLRFAGLVAALAASLLLGCGGGAEEADDESSPAATNVAPLANAGADQHVTAGASVVLDGSSSSDADGDRLAYAWTLTGKPAGSAASLADARSARPTFTADLPGTYFATLVVNDGTVDSVVAGVTVTVSTTNAAPVANAGRAQSVTTGTAVTLDGSASADANGDPLTYTWTLTTRPAGSQAALTGATSARPTFTADVAGSYVATLTVSDGAQSSAAATVTVAAASGNAAPVAHAGPAQAVVVGAMVTLDGSASSDANGDALTYAWTLTGRPMGSAAVLSGPTSAAPSFNADLAGTYVATLVVNDGQAGSAPATVTITASATNAAPVANAGPAQSVTAGMVVTLDGRASSDANGDALTYAWTLTSRPAGSTAALVGATTARPAFTADLAGTYVTTLVVGDGQLNSAPVTVTITAGALLDGAVLWTRNCSGCHGVITGGIGRKSASAAVIQSAINANRGGMGFLRTLTAAEVQAIADAAKAANP